MAFIFDCIKDYLDTGKIGYLEIIADHLSDTRSDHPEFAVYFKRLKSGKVRTRTILDVGIKFGDKHERKGIAKLGRTLLKDKSRGSRHFQLKVFRSNDKFNGRVQAIIGAVKINRCTN